MHSPFLIFSLVLVGLALGLSQKSQAQDPNFHIYLCFGQSNMEGQGEIAPADRVADPRFQVLQSLNCPELGREKGQWYEAVPPLCQCYSGLSPVDQFGRTLLAGLPDSIRVGVVHVAVGGCDIRLFDKDLYPEYDSTYAEAWFTDKVAGYGGNPYQHLTALAKQAQRDGVIKGILLHQGETNTGDAQWPNYVQKIYQDLLTDLSLEAEQTPLLAGEMVSVEGSCCGSMNAIVNTLPQVIPNAHVISSEGCTAMDTAHFDAAGYRELGRRYGRRMLSLLAGAPED
ncbi:MAG TPA: sialate O-acetylesterase [Cytophagales bacterium]|nr:sialate O-acetylesterase [Cytophagales bacterium]